MVRDGLFKGVDCCMAWHPMGFNIIPYECAFQALTAMEFQFRGKTSHAAISPEFGRSAMDAAELMNIGVQYLREHVSDDVRIHYAYTAIGERPNIVPDYAALSYLIRAKDMQKCQEVTERVGKIAQGAAMMTETSLNMFIDHAFSETVIIHSFNEVLHKAALKIPQLLYTPEERAFADTLYENVMDKKPNGDILPSKVGSLTGTTRNAPGSTDVGYITYTIPTARLFGFGIPCDIPMHHWGVTAAAGSSIGHKAALFAGKAIAQCGYDILCNPKIIECFKAELRATTAGKNFQPIWPDKKEGNVG
jgi:aminobenzoyl-glutamate utilization protein B